MNEISKLALELVKDGKDVTCLLSGCDALLTKLCTRMGVPFDKQEDYKQTILCAAIKSLKEKKWDPKKSSFTNWLWMKGRGVIIDLFKKNEAEQEMTFVDVDEIVKDEEGYDAPKYGKIKDTKAEDFVVKLEQNDRIKKELIAHNFSKEQIEIIYKVIGDDWTIKECAKAHKVGESTVKRVVQKFKQIFG
jgi:RNA polymerase sigma factor (sigma-70 family)